MPPNRVFVNGKEKHGACDPHPEQGQEQGQEQASFHSPKSNGRKKGRQGREGEGEGGLR